MTPSATADFPQLPESATRWIDEQPAVGEAVKAQAAAVRSMLEARERVTELDAHILQLEDERYVVSEGVADGRASAIERDAVLSNAIAAAHRESAAVARALSSVHERRIREAAERVRAERVAAARDLIRQIEAAQEIAKVRTRELHERLRAVQDYDHQAARLVAPAAGVSIEKAAQPIAVDGTATEIRDRALNPKPGEWFAVTQLLVDLVPFLEVDADGLDSRTVLSYAPQAGVITIKQTRLEHSSPQLKLITAAANATERRAHDVGRARRREQRRAARELQQVAP